MKIDRFFVIKRPDGSPPSYQHGWFPWEAIRFNDASNAAFEAARLTREVSWYNGGRKYTVHEVTISERALDDAEAKSLMAAALDEAR